MYTPLHPVTPDFKSMPSMSLRKETFENGCKAVYGVT